MPGYLLNANSIVLCAHAGQAKPTAPNPRVRIMGAPIVVQPFPYAIAGCVNPPPPANVGPCITALWVTGAARIRVMGMPVLLQDSQSICAPTGTPLNVVFTQLRVKGM
jgi:hypothetical protein